jgi:hypothetical protein
MATPKANVQIYRLGSNAHAMQDGQAMLLQTLLRLPAMKSMAAPG